MTLSSPFHQLAHLITVEDICSPFITIIDADRSITEVWEEWSIDLCFERGLDPMEQIALVEKEGKTKGWIGYEMLETNRTVFECMEQVSPDIILTANTSLVEAVNAFSAGTHHFFLILKGNHFIGWLSYNDLHKPPLRLCLFAMLINIERLLLDVALLSAQESVGLLSAGRLTKANEIYVLRKYNYDKDSKPYSTKLLECTSLADKISIAKKSTTIKHAIPALRNKAFCDEIEPLRNEIAHPGIEERSSLLLSRERLWPFIEWASAIESELEELKQTKTFSGSKVVC